MKRKAPEQTLHRQVARYLNGVLRPPVIWSTFPSGGGGRVRGAILKAAGLAPGMPDILVFAPGPIVLGIELKAPKGAPSRTQLDMVPRFADFGGIYRFCRSVDDVERALAEAGIKTALARIARAA